MVWVIVYTNYYACEYQDEPDTEILGVADSKESAQRWLDDTIKTIPYNVEWVNFREYNLIF